MFSQNRFDILVFLGLLASSLSACNLSSQAKATLASSSEADDLMEAVKAATEKQSPPSGSVISSLPPAPPGGVQAPAPQPSPAPLVVASPSPSPKPLGPATSVVLSPADNSSREFFDDFETKTRTVAFDFTGEKSDCSRDGGITWAACDSEKSIVWKLDDFEKVHSVRVQSYGRDPVVAQFTPSVLYPKYRVLACDVTIQGLMGFKEFQDTIAVPGKSRARPRGICLENGSRVENNGSESWITFTADNVFVMAAAGASVTFHNGRVMSNFTGWSLGQEKGYHPLYGVFNVDARKGIGFKGIQITSASHFGVGIHGDEKTDLFVQNVRIETKGEMAFPLFIQSTKTSSSLAKVDIRNSQFYANGYSSAAVIESSVLSIYQGTFVSTFQGDAIDLKDSDYKITYSSLREAGGNTVTLYSDHSKGLIEDSVIYDGSGAGAIDLARGSQLTLNRSRLIRAAVGTPEYIWYDAGYAVIGGYGESQSANTLNSTSNGNLVCQEKSTYKFRGIKAPGVSGNLNVTQQLNGLLGAIGLCL